MAPRQKNTTVEPLSQDDFQSLLLEQARMAILGKAVDQGPGLFYPVVGQTVPWATAMNLERIWPVTEEYGRQKRTGLVRPVRYNLMVQHPSDWHNNSGVIRNAHARGMGVIRMRPLTSGVFQRLMAEAWAAGAAAIEIDAVSRGGAGGGPPAAR